MGRLQVIRLSLSPTTLPDNSIGHVSAFAARKKAAHPNLSDASDYALNVRSVVGENPDGSNFDKKRKSGPVAVITASQGVKSKRKKIKRLDEQESISQVKPLKDGVQPIDAAQDRHTTTTHSEVLNAGGLIIAGATTKPNVEDETNPLHCGHDLRPGNSATAELEACSESELQTDPECTDDHPRIPYEAAFTAREDRQLSTFVPTNGNVVQQTRTTWTVSIKEGDTLTLAGQYEIWVRKGAISILGAVLYQSSTIHRIFAPSTHSLPSIRPIRDPFRPGNQQTTITIFNCNGGLRLLRQVSPKFSRLWNTTGLRSAESTPALDLSKRTFQYLYKSLDDAYRRPLRVLETPGDWHILSSALVSQGQVGRPKAILVCGPKGSGKSTFSRMITNAILTKLPTTSKASSKSSDSPTVALLDVDPGQPEFSPPGEISLVQIQSCNLGPPFSHPSANNDGVKLIRSHYIGSTSPKDDPQHYLRCVLDLLHHYKQMLSQHPSCSLIMNTAGWIQGTGLELLVDFIRHIGLTDVIYTSMQGPSEVVETISKATTKAEIPLHFLTSEPVEVPARSAADLRTMQTLSYFHLDDAEMGYLRWNAKPIYDMTPLSVYYAGPNQAIYGVLLLGQELDTEFLHQVLEGCIVGLVVVENDAALPPLSEAQKPESLSNNDSSHDDQSSDNDPSSSDSNDPNFVFPDTSVLPNPPLNYNQTHTLPRTSSQIPYLPATSSLTPPLPPIHTRSLGQALIASIFPDTHTLNLITPIPLSTLDALHSQQKKIVLVKGDLETPTWALKEDLYRRTQRRRGVIKEGLYDEQVEDWGKEDTRRWAEGRAYISLDNGRGRGRVRRVRRDLGKKRAK